MATATVESEYSVNMRTKRRKMEEWCEKRMNDLYADKIPKHHTNRETHHFGRLDIEDLLDLIYGKDNG